MKWLTSFHEIRDAKAKADKSALELKTTQANQDHALREAAITDMIDKIRTVQNQAQANHLGIRIDFDNVRPGPEDDADVFWEAMRRTKNKTKS